MNLLYNFVKCIWDIEGEISLLEDLYDYHFESGGDAYLIEEFNEDRERRLAYLYLPEKGYIDLFIDEIGANAKITAAGIEIDEGGRIKIH